MNLWLVVRLPPVPGGLGVGRKATGFATSAGLLTRLGRHFAGLRVGRFPKQRAA